MPTPLLHISNILLKHWSKLAALRHERDKTPRGGLEGMEVSKDILVFQVLKDQDRDLADQLVASFK